MATLPIDQEYFRAHDIEKLFESMMESLALEKPADPRAYLAQHLTRHSLLSFQDISSLLEAFKQISTAVSPDLASMKVIDTTCAMLHCDRASLFLYDEAHNVLRMVVGKGARGILLAENSGFTWRVFKSATLINVKDAYSDPAFDASIDISTGYKTDSMLGAPVKDSAGKTIGVLLALNKSNGHFTAKDEAVIMQLVGQTGVLINNSIYYEKAVNNELKSKALLNFVRQIAKDVPGQSLALELVAKAKDLLQSETCNIFMVDHSRDLLVPIATGDHSVRQSLHAEHLMQAVKKGEILNIDNTNANLLKEMEKNTGHHTESLLIVPIRAKDRVIGVVQATNKHSDAMFGDMKVYSRFDESDAELLITFNELLAKKLEKLIETLGKAIEDTTEKAVNFQSGFGRVRRGSRELPEGAIRESEEEEERT